MQGTQTLLSPSNNKKNTTGIKARLTIQFAVLGLLLSQPLFLSYSYASPLGGNIVGGTGSISQQDIHTTINQTSQKLAIDWQSFDVQQNEHVHFIQPNASSIALNRILGNNGSVIQGQIDANGQVILVNPNGVFFTSTATVNVGGLVASSLDMTPTDFMNGNYIFNEVIGANGAVVNSGLINASTGGNVALIGKQVKNTGLITANLGSVVLAAGKQSVLTFDNQGLIGVRVTKEVLQNEGGVEEAVINSGTIQAAGGRVLLTASTSQDVFSQAVNSGSLNQATSVVVNADGSFTLGGGADVLNTGSIDVSSASSPQNTARIVLLGENINSSGEIKADVSTGQAGEIEIHAKDKTLLTASSLTSAQASTSGQGGLIKVLGDKVGLFDTAQVNASGANGGGEVLIGGDRQGLNSAIRNAQFTYLGENTAVYTDGLATGDGGKLITFASDTARIYGNLSARGGVIAGDGGFIETSGLKGFVITATPDISAVNGNGGTWLIDPYSINIVNTGTTTGITENPVNTFTSTSSPAALNVSLIESGLQSGDVIVTTGAGGDINGGAITFDADLNINDNQGTLSGTLSLLADRDIVFADGSSIYSSNPNTNDRLSVILRANKNNDGSGNIEFNGTTINTFGGSFVIEQAVNITSTGNNSILTTGGNFSVDNAVDFNTSSLVIDTDTGNVDLDGAGTGVTGIITLGNITAANFTSTSGTSIGQAGGTALNISGLTDLAATATNSIDLSNAGNDFNRVNFRNAVNVTLTDGAGGIDIAANDGVNPGGIKGNLTLTASGGDITDYAEVNAGDDGFDLSSFTVDNDSSIYLDTANNTFNGSLSFSAASGSIRDITVVDDTQLFLPDISISRNLDVTGSSIVFNNITVGGGLDATTTDASTGSIEQNLGSIVVGGTATLDAVGDVILTDTGNDFVDLQVDNGQVVSIRDSNAINLRSSNTDNDFTLTAGGDIYLSGDVTTNTNSGNAPADVTFNGDVRLSASTDTINTSSSNGAVLFNGAIDNDGGGNPRNNLEIVTQDGNVTVSGEIGTLRNIGSLVINKNIANSASIVSLNRVRTREVSSAPATAGIDITASTINLNGNLQTNRGTAGYARDIILNGNVVLNNDITLDTRAGTGDGAITVNGTINSDATARSLTITSDTGRVSLQSAVGGTSALDYLWINSGSQTAQVNLSSVTTNGGSNDIRVDGTTINLSGNLTTSTAGDIRLDGSVVLNSNVTINSNGNGTNGDIDINGNINGASATNTYVLSMNSAASDTTLQNIGDAERIQQLNLSSTSGNIDVGSAFTRDNLTGADDSGINITSTSGLITLNGGELRTNVIGAAGDGTGNVDISGTVVLANDVLVDTVDGNGNSNAVSFTGSIDADNATNNRNLSITAGTSTVDLSANIGATDAINGLRVRSGNVTMADVKTRSGGIDIVTDSSVVGNINLTGALNTKAGNDAGEINLRTLGSLGRIDLNMSANDAVFNTNSTGGADADITLDANILNNSAKNLVIDAGSADVFVPRNAGIGSTRLASFTVDAQNATIGSVNSNGAISITAANTGTISLGGTLYANNGDIALNAAPVVLIGNAGLNINNTVANNILVDGTINADDANNDRTLTVNMGSGTLNLGGSIGNTQALQSLSITTTAGGTVYLPSVTTQSGGVTVSTSRLYVNGDIDTTSLANGGDISLTAQRLDLANNTTLTTNASLSDGAIFIYNPGSGVGIDAAANDFILDAGAGNVTLQQRVINTAQFDIQSSGTTMLSGVSADSNGGTITVNASNGLTLNGSYSGITATNDQMSFNADSDANGSGTLILGATSAFTNVNGPISFTGAALSTPGTFSINASGGANTVSFAATGDMSVGTNTLGLILNNTQLGYITASDINLAAANDLYLSDVSQITGPAYVVSAGNDIITSGNTYSYFSSLTANATNNIIFNRGIYTENNLNLAAASLDAQGYTVLRSYSGDITVDGNITGAINQTLNLYAPSGLVSLASGSSVSNMGYFRIYADTIQLNSVDISAGGIYLYQTNAANSFNIDSNLTSSGYVYLYASNDLDLASNTNVIANTYMTLLSFNGDVLLSSVVNNGGYSTTIQAAKGQVIDNNGSAVNISSDASVTIVSNAGVGDGNALELAMNGDSARLSITNKTSGNIEINNAGDIRLENIENNSGAGGFNFANDGKVTFNKVSISRTKGLAEFNITNGDIVPVPGISGAHLTAYHAIFKMNNTGSVGQLGNPLITDVPYTIEVTGSLGTYIEYLGGIPPKDFIGDNDYKNRALQVIESLSSKQLIEVESLAAIDPAIFTDVRNYAHSDIALMMPADQRYTDDEEEDEEAKMKRKEFINSVN